MERFSATEAALEGFRLTRERPVAVGFWALVYLAIFLVSGVIMLGVFGASWATFMESQDSPDDASAALAALGPALAVISPVLLLGIVVMMTAMYRAVLFPEQSRAGYLRLGGDELRVFVTLLVLGLIYLALLFVGIFVIAIAAAATSGFLRGLLVFLGVVAMICLVFWVFTRLSLLSPIAVAEKRIDLRRAWTLSKGRFWPMFGAYALAFILALVVGIFSGIVSAALLAIFGGGLGALAQANNPDFSSFGVGLAVGFTLYLIVQVIASALQLVLTTVPPAQIYTQLTEKPGTAEVFA